jgi:hypothetical protein
MIDSLADRTSAPPLARLETLTVLGIVGLFALALGLAGLTAGGSSVTKKIKYTQSGVFSYSATAPVSSAYGSAGLVTGQPIVTGVVGPVKTRFDYRFTTRAAVQTHGTASMAVTVTVAQGFTREFPVATSKSFTGNSVAVTGTLPLDDIASFISATTAALGSEGGPTTATIALTPKVNVAGTVAGQQLRTSYSPSLPFTFNGATLTVSQNQSSTSVGAPAADPTTPSAAGAVTYQTEEPASVNLLVAHPSASVAMGTGFGVALLCLALGLMIGRPLLGSDAASESDRIRALYASHLLPVRSLRVPEVPIAEVASMSALAELAKRYETMIMHVQDDGRDAYLLWDDGMLYCYGDGAVVGTGPDGVVRSA